MTDRPEKFRKRPVVVDAMRYTGDNGQEVLRWCGPGGGGYGPTGISISTLEGVMTADVGDWIIRGVAGEFYPCKPDIFDATYEQADD